MRTLALAPALLTLLFSVGTAQAGTCHENAAERKLAGAAKTSFLKKCEKDAGAACDISAADKKLAGAAKTSHLKKCAADAVGKSS